MHGSMEDLQRRHEWGAEYNGNVSISSCLKKDQSEITHVSIGFSLESHNISNLVHFEKYVQKKIPFERKAVK